MASCNYRVLNDIYNTIEQELTTISEKIEGLELNIDINELDIDLDNLETQLTISNKLKLLELVGTDVMTEDDQKAAYNEIKHTLFPDADDVFGIEGPTFDVEESEF